MVSLVLIVNKQDIYTDFLRNLYIQKGVDYEIVPIYNINHEYKSARKAYNDAKKRISGDIVIFMHPDIRFLEKYSLKKFVDLVRSISEFGVVGVAGARESKKNSNDSEILAGIVHGPDKREFGTIQVKTIEEVQTVDECMFAVSKDYFVKHPFSDLSGWHLYAVDYCLEAIQNSRRNYVVPCQIWHLSDGASLDEKYVEQVDIIIKKWRNHSNVIYTTIKTWPTKGLYAYLYRKYYWLKQRIKRMIVRR